MAAFKAATSLLVTLAVNPAGATTPNQTGESNPGNPLSAIVGTFGNRLLRVSELTASALTCPASTLVAIDPIDENKIGIWPPNKSVRAPAPPL